MLKLFKKKVAKSETTIDDLKLMLIGQEQKYNGMMLRLREFNNAKMQEVMNRVAFLEEIVDLLTKESNNEKLPFLQASIEKRKRKLAQGTEHKPRPPKKRRKEDSSSYSRYTGVQKYAIEEGKAFRYRATLCVNGKIHRIGGFVDEIEAARAYDRMVITKGGQKARLNFPIENYKAIL